jgi:hypothetical protein
MLTKEQYEYFNQFRDILNLFEKTGQYIGGCHPLFVKMGADTSCPSCMSRTLLEAIGAIKEYERNM